MSRNTRLGSFLFTILLVMALSAIMTVPALADDGPPPADGTTLDAPVESPSTDPAVDVAPSTEIAPTDPAPEVDAAPTNPAPAEDFPTVEPEITDAGATGTTPPVDLSQVPAGTDVVVVDANGVPVSLGTTQAAQIVSEGDPMWCPNGVTPGGAGCTASTTSFSALLSLITTKTVAGTIWIASSYVGTSALEGGSVTLNCSLTTICGYALTLKGGWSGTLGTTTILSTPSRFNVPLAITGWTADVTLSDILITGVTGTGTTALTIITTKNISLTRVDVVGNAGAGANLNNSGGTGNVTVASSRYNTNGGTASGKDGLVVNSKGVITLNTVTASGNGGAGAYLNNSTASTALAVTLTGTNIFSDNVNDDGLGVISKGSITGNNITASGNGYDGAYLENSLASTPLSVTLTGINTFSGNSNNGLDVYSKGLITVSDLTATGNGWSGAYLHNNISTSTAGITLTGTNILSENDASGVEIYSYGPVLLSNLVNNGNTWDGVYIDNTGASSAQPVTLTGNSEFKFNGTGLIIYTKGLITLNNISADFNNGSGAILDNSSSATAAGVTLTGFNHFADNYNTGLVVTSKGAVTLNNVTANANGNTVGGVNVGYGVTIDNSTAAAAQAVKLLGTNAFLGNVLDGLAVHSKGTISVNNVTANYNGARGAYLNNCVLSDNYCQAPLTSGINLTGTNTFSNNYTDGLWVKSLGAITVNNLTARDNGSTGAYLDNQWVYKLSGVLKSPLTGISFTGYVTASGNDGIGLEAYSSGAIAGNNVTASDNGSEGAKLENCVFDDNGTANHSDDYCLAPLNSGITLTGTNNFRGNSIDGLSVMSLGAITVNNLTAKYNGGSGAYLDNQWVYKLLNVSKSPLTGISILGYVNASNNGFDGLSAYSSGAIVVNNVTASDNTSGAGVDLVNQVPGATGGVSVNNTAVFSPEFARNGFFGLSIVSNGNITIMDLDAYENGFIGVYLDNFGGNGNVSLGTSRLNWVNLLANNFSTGLVVISSGTVTLSNILASWNGKYNDTDKNYAGYGAFIDNSGAGAPKTVSLLGTNQFNGNASGGLYVTSKGAITLSNLTANGNGINAEGGDGVHLVNIVAAAAQPVTLTGNNNFNNNWNNGLFIISTGAISLNNVTSDENGDGAELDNTFSGTTLPQNVTLTGFGEFDDNYNNGLKVSSYGAITLNNITANGNAHYVTSTYGFGVFLDNSDGTAPKAVILTGSNGFYNNQDGGLDIYSSGAISLNDVSADENGFGIRLDNTGAGASGGVSITTGVWTSNNDTYGMNITSKGAITISAGDAFASQNGSYGWNLDNHTASLPAGVTLTSPNPDWAFDFVENGTYGLRVQSLGTISITGLDADNNGGYGAELDNSGAGATGTISITSPAIGDNSFYGNGGDGLVVYSNRAITIGTIIADGNGGNGVWLDNSYSGAALPQNVTITGTNSFNFNFYDGLDIFSYGAVAVNSIDASGNGVGGTDGHTVAGPQYGFGVYIDNTNTSSVLNARPVTFTGTNTFWGNYNSGLEVFSSGAVSLSNVETQGNGYYYGPSYSFPGSGTGYSGCGKFVHPGDKDFHVGCGAYVDNSSALTPLGVTFTGNNSFESNDLTGLTVLSNGAITLNNVTASANGGDGALLDNQHSSQSAITLTGINAFDGNGGNGLKILSHGAITLNNVDASSNILGGADIDAAGLTSAANITIGGTNTFGFNGSDGLNVSTDGVITLNNIGAYVNRGRGAYLNNSVYGFAGSLPAVRLSLTGYNIFNSNLGNGLEFQTLGNVTMTRVTADNNIGAGSNGVLGTATGNITLTCGSMNRNGDRGYDLTSTGSSGVITLTGVIGYRNNLSNRVSAPSVINNRLCTLP